MSIPALKKIYQEKVVPELKKNLGIDNPHLVPNLEKIVVSSGIRSEMPKEWVQEVVKEVAKITGQQPVVTKASKSIANFKLREGQPNGVKVTLRGDKMYEFLDRLFSVALPRVRDFRGINPNSFDGRGNYAFGLKEQIIFPEIDFDKVDAVRGMDICFVTTAKTDEEAKELLKALGAPFAN